MLKLFGQMFPVILSLFEDAGILSFLLFYMISGGGTSATVIPASAVIYRP